LAAVQNTLQDKRSKVVADVRSSQLVVVATEKEQIDVVALVERLDTQTKQVLIEARILETAMNPKTAKGIDWRGTLQNQNFSYGNGTMSGSSHTVIPGTPVTTTTPSGKPITTTPNSTTTTILDSVLGSSGGISANTASGLTPNIGFLNADGLHAVLSFINQDSSTKVISSPRTVTLDNETSTIEVGTMFPIINTQAGTANTAGGSQINYSNLTVRLEVTPRVSANNFIHLKVLPKILRLGDPVTTIQGDQKNTVFQFEKREVNTSVLIPSGNTLVMGGLVSDDLHKDSTKVPVLGDLPLLGSVFRSDAKTRLKNNLLIFVTPTIVQTEDFQPSTTDFLKTPMPPELTAPDWTAWDSTKPMDWSKPLIDKEAPKSTTDWTK
jgi:type II secretory pathway component GspD/PulD (secretin)